VVETIMIDVILPVLNERLALPSVLASIPAGYRPIVVDNGSDDGSADLARTLGATVVPEPRRGFGAACWAGLQAAQSEAVCFMDCDGSLDGADLPRVVAGLRADPPTLVLGRRVPVSRDAWPVHARMANRVLSRQIRRQTSLDLRDIGPMRAAPREGLLQLGLQDRRFGWPLEMVLRAAGAGWRVTEIDVPYAARAGRSKVTGTVRGTARTIADMRAVMRK
jgi:glycosyltransferase involved in cell wall biosynthesis